MVVVVRWRSLVVRAGSFVFGTGRSLEDRTGAAATPASAAREVVADLDYPPGNIAVSASGRVFLTLHPDGKPPIKVVELVDGKPVPFPDEAFQQRRATTPHFQTAARRLRIDRQNRLWVLDFADFGRGQPRLLAFDLDTNALVHQYDFPTRSPGLRSMLNDFQVSPDGGTIYIAESSPIMQTRRSSSTTSRTSRAAACSTAIRR